MTPVTKRILASAFIMALVFITLVYSEETLSYVKVLLDSGYVSLFMWAYVVGSVLMHAIVVVKPRSKAYDFFENYSNSIYAIGTYGIGGSTSIALLKGLFFQHFYDGYFFKGFSSFDLVSMFILSSFLLIYSLLNSTRVLAESIFYTSASEVSATTEVRSI